MLKITSDGRKLALDQRIMNPLLADDPGRKVNACVDNVFKIWQESTPAKGTQLIFSDLSTPKGRAEPKKEEAKESAEGTETEGEAAATEEETIMEASVYEDIRKKLIAKGIPSHEIAFIHDANTEAQKAELFAKVRNGQVRVLLGSTQKMGAGTNVQTKLIASHDLDCPWRPADLEQRAGRIVRRGKEIELGEYRGFPMKLCFDGAKFKVTMKQHLTHTAELSDDVVGNITRINNALEKIPQSLERHRENMVRLHKELESAKEEAERPFAQEEELLEKSARLAELNTVLDNEEKGRGGEPARETEEEEGRQGIPDCDP